MKFSRERTPFSAKTASCRVAAIYAVVAGMWILFSDRILLWYLDDPDELTRVQSVKGWLFVVATAAMLAWLIRHYTQKSYSEKALLDDIISNIPLYVFWKDREGRYLGCNQRFASVAGVGKRENINGKTDHDLAWRRGEADLMEQSDRLVMDKREPLLDVEEVQRQADGEEAVYLTSKVPLEDESGGVIGMVGICADVTLRKREEEALRESEERFRSVFETAAAGMATLSTKGRFLQANSALCRFLGYTEEELLNLDIEEITHPEDLDRARRLYGEVMEGRRQAFDYEKRYIRKDGSVVWGHATVAGVLDTAGKPLCYAGLVQDITDHKRAEEALRESERRLSTLMGNLPGMAYRCRNDRDWTMEFVSEGCLEMTGYAPGDLIGNRSISYAEIIHPEDQEEVWQKIQAALEKGNPFRIEYRISTAGGEERWVWEQGVGVYAEEGDLVALEGFITDVTERKRAEETLRESDRMKTEFVTTAAHEFRTPLTSIQGYAELLLTEKNISSKQREEFSSYIYNRSNALAKTVTDLLDIARIEAGQGLALNRSPCTVKEIFNQMQAFLETKSNRHRPKVELKEEECHLDIDQGKMVQVLENLISNAFKYSAEDSLVQIHGTPTPEGYQVTVVDQGVGMTPKQTAKVFDKFYRADASHTAVEGIGLGMSVIKQIVEAHGGRIWVESEPGEGTTVGFTMPLESHFKKVPDLEGSCE